MMVSLQYHDYAAVYDSSGQLRFSILMDLYLRDLLREHSVPGRDMIDLGCGTGTLAILMAERGWRVRGIDRSAAMLQEAEQKLQRLEQPLDVVFAEGDMRDFAAPDPIDLVTCCYDTLNYLLTADELSRCFAAVARALTPDGLWCFDLATDFFLRQHWQGTEVEEYDGVTQIMQSHYDVASGLSTLVLTGFVPAGGQRRRRFREVHVERAYAEAEVCALLHASGFAVEAVYDCFTFGSPHERSLREMYVARRR